jgi:hypothetical protein
MSPHRLGKTKLQTFPFSPKANLLSLKRTLFLASHPTKPSTASHFPSLLQASIPLQFLLVTSYIKSDNNGTNSASFEP